MGICPRFWTVITLFVFARKDFVSRLPLKTLTVLHIIRIPVEIVLHWLFQNGQIPQLMTFEGRNFDLSFRFNRASDLLAGVRGGKTNRPLLIVWNLIALGLLINIVTHAFLSFPFPLQQLAFDQPNRSVLYFPFVWLPTIVVPIVLFCHLASLWQLFSESKIKTL
jgi:hypothetical protein